mmetsp:Transcript_1990/g.4005  ORF Transcript_1990/g.4005 Transcript_1990/m.4005 type:complete len:502 (+) Transcript_1990:224-1729(+)
MLSQGVMDFFLPFDQTPVGGNINNNDVCYVELANLSKVSTEWRDKVLDAMVVTLGGDNGSRKTKGFNAKLKRALCWFDETGIEIRSVRLRRSGGKSKNEKEVNLASTWRGWSDDMEVLSFFGFTDTFCSMLTEKMNKLDENDQDNDKMKDHESAASHSLSSSAAQGSLIIGTNVAYPLSKSEEPQVLLNSHSNLPCIQFLNFDGTCAVRMRTTEFACGSIPQPVTIFIVGIASEDGCFLSGLRGRFEIGHMYPENDVVEAMDMSKVVITASRSNSSVHRNVSSSVGGLRFQDGCSSDDSSSSDESELSMDSVPPSEHVIKGKSRPGRWHVYTAVFDGSNSYIRVDGQEEGRGSDGNKRGVGEGNLTGFTIGSDHFFNMSLCDGGAGLQLDNGQGGGAIAEMGAFKGVMDRRDIEYIEGILMNKHGIAKGTEDSLKEDEYKFQSHSLIAQPPPWSLIYEQGIPLKWAAREKSVVWKRDDPITGDKIVISRIGTNKTGSDSEW